MSGSSTARTQARAVTHRDAEILGLFREVLQAYEPHRDRCWPCFIRRRAWNVQHGDAWAKAVADARESAGLPDTSPVPFEVAVSFLPEELRPDRANPTGTGGQRMPAAFNAVLQEAGTGLCEMDAEARADQIIEQMAQAEAARAAQNAQHRAAAGGAQHVAAAATTSSAAAATPDETSPAA